MVQLSTTRSSCITMYLNECLLLLLFHYQLSPETFGYTLIYRYNKILIHFRQNRIMSQNGWVLFLVTKSYRNIFHFLSIVSLKMYTNVYEFHRIICLCFQAKGRCTFASTFHNNHYYTLGREVSKSFQTESIMK
jgi:hypothetical protein